MRFNSVIGATCACLAVVSFSANAIPTEADWKVEDDGLITYDENTGLEWLDITYTTSRSYTDISSQLGLGGEFEGWHYASSAEVAILWNSFGGDGSYNGWSTSNNGLFDIVAPLLGDTYCQDNSCEAGNGFTGLRLADAGVPGEHGYAFMSDWAGHPTEGFLAADHDYFNELNGGLLDGSVYSVYGHALIRTSSTVPEPPIVLLLGSGLIGLIGVARRKANA